MSRQIRVLIIEDSAFMRRELTKIINTGDNLVVIGAAIDAEDGIEMAKKLDPDVITIDVNLPGMDGITCLQHIMIEIPRPCVMISAYTKRDSIETFEALELGAVDFVQKPSGEISKDIWHLNEEIHVKLQMAAKANLNALTRFEPFSIKMQLFDQNDDQTPDKIVVIGVSTGGPRTMMHIIPKIPEDIGAPILLVQHMPRKFTRNYAERLNQYSQIFVKEAEHGEPLQNNIVYVAQGERNLMVETQNEMPRLHVEMPAKGDLYVPSVDKNIHSAIDIFKDRCIGVVLTGMGNDGSSAMQRLFQIGGHTIAESEETAVIYGMPQDVIKAGAAKIIAPAHEIAKKIELAVKKLNK
jgi:two-component system chemotaxis response regulator CheB